MDSTVLDKSAVKRVMRNSNGGELARKIEIACKRLSVRALQVLEQAMNNESIEMKHRIDAAKEILNRAWGRPKQSVEANVTVHTGEQLIEAITQSRERMANVIDVTPKEIETKTLN